MTKKAFSLVELIVVMSLIVILASIGYFSYLDYAEESKDSNRVTQSHTIGDGIDLYLSKGVKIEPDNSIDIFFDGEKYSSQGIVGDRVIGQIKYLSDGVDPKDKTPFVFALANNKKDYDMMALLENEINMPKKLLSGNFTKIGNRTPYVYGKNSVGIMLDQFGNPVNNSLSGSLNLNCNDSNNYSLIFENGRVLTPVTWQSEFETGPCYIEPAPGCKPTPGYTNASFNIGTPTKPNQDWVKADSSESCSYQCINGYTGIFCEVLPGVALSGGLNNIGQLLPSEINTIVNTRKFAIYYGYPSSLNPSSNGYRLDNVINDLNKYNVVYFGKGLEQTTHLDHNNLKTILDGASPGEFWYSEGGFSGYSGRSYGYVTLLDSYSNIVNSIDLWISLGVDGIFLDEAGYDFLVGAGTNRFGTQIAARNHQNNVINYIHSLGKNTIINSWNIDDVLGTNYGESNSTLNGNDSFLMESFVYNFLNVGNNYYDYDNQILKLNKAIDYKNNLGIKLYCVGLLPNHTFITNERIQDFYEKSNNVCDFAQITEQSFGTESPILRDYLTGLIN